MHNSEMKYRISKALVYSQGGKRHFGRIRDRGQPQRDFKEPRDEIQSSCSFLLPEEFENGPAQALHALL